MNLNLHDFLPDEMSDEAVYHLIKFLTELVYAMDSYYYTQMSRYLEDREIDYLWLSDDLIDENMDDEPIEW